MKYTFEFSFHDCVNLMYALKKGTSRHSSYARFYPSSGKAKKHEEAAKNMSALRRRISNEVYGYGATEK